MRRACSEGDTIRVGLVDNNAGGEGSQNKALRGGGNTVG